MGRTSILVMGLLLALLSLPLIGRRVPMNRFYGVRTAAAFKSEQNWYEINAYGGWQMLGVGLLMSVIGLAGFLLPERYQGGYGLGAPLLVVFMISVVVIKVVLWSRRYGS